MPKFYDPSKPDRFLSAPNLFQTVPIKHVIICMQLLAIFLQVTYLILSTVPSKIQMSLQMASILMSAFTVAVFIIEHKSLIRAHFWAAIVFSAAPIALVVLASLQFFSDFRFLVDMFGVAFQKHYVTSFVLSILILCSYAAYLLLCYWFIYALDQQPDEYPELDTTQGLFHYKRDAYDGSERVKLMYPEV